ncbi:autotransporter outer membrane beta-barrel domain-containing protein [Microvirga roseola]|uniref:autotransporter outer membrane beta-barrel domain-containing protein n=1 Tax=Microvirga roseola TaxID=2883126 RepID=UPI0022A80C43|nr:autotransporter outer membrane beta-barrel domain-containing protein [Microvirga roseola]
MNNSGTIAPGNSIGTLTIVGPVTFNAGSSLEVEVDPQGRSDLLRIDGTAILNGGTVRVLPLAGLYTAQSRYVILTASGGVTGQFSDARIPHNFAFLTPTLFYSANDVALVLTRNERPIDDMDDESTDPPPDTTSDDDPEDDDGGNDRNDEPGGNGRDLPGGNPLTIGGVLDALPLTNPVVEAVVSLDEANVRPALDLLSGELYPSLAAAWLDESRLVREAVLNRLRQASAQSGIPAFVAAQGLRVSYTADVAGGRQASPVPAPDPAFALWGQAFGSFGRLKGDGFIASLDRSTRGFVLGADYRQGPWRVGIVGGYTQTSLDQQALSASAHLDTYYVGAYGGFSLDGLEIKVGWRPLHRA